MVCCSRQRRWLPPSSLPTVVAIVRVLAFSFVLQGLGSPAQSLLRRRMRFRDLAMVEVSSHVLGYMAVGLTAALLGAGAWSLVAAGLAQALGRDPERPGPRAPPTDAPVVLARAPNSLLVRGAGVGDQFL
jgi:hypothetical protein